MSHELVKTLPASRSSSTHRRLLVSACVSSIGDGFTIVAFGLMAVRLTRDPRLVTSVFVAGRLPWVFGLWLARFVDRCRRPAVVLVVADIVRAVVLGATAMIVWTAGGSIPLLCCAAAVIGVGTLCHSAARSAILPVIASGRALAKMNGYLSSAEGLGYAAIGPALGGLAFTFGHHVPLAVDSLSFAASAILLCPLTRLVLPGGPRPRTADGGRGLVRAVLSHRLLSVLLAQTVALGFTQSIVLGMTPLFVQSVLGVSPGWYGVFLAAAAIGGIVTGVLTPHLWSERSGTFFLVHGAGIAGGLAYYGFADQRTALSALAFLFVYDATVGIMNTVSPTLRLEHAPADARARTATLFRQAIYSVQPVGALLGGAIAHAYGVRAAITVAGLAAVGCFALTAIPLRRAVVALGA